MNLLPMRKFYWITSLVIITVTALMFIQVPTSNAADNGLNLLSPTTCPTTGCAAGQRLNFRIDFAVSPQNPTTNTQVCIYAPVDGLSGEGSSPWAIFSTGWVSKTGLISGEPYEQGQVDSICADQTDQGDAWLSGAFAYLKSGPSDQLDFALHINPQADVDGYIKVKILELAPSNGSWKETASFTHPISVAKLDTTVYVAQNPSSCGDFKPCFVNSGDNRNQGVGTGLRDAVIAVQPNDRIRILKNYSIKDHAVLVDKNVAIRGYENAMITYIGNVCTNPMLTFTNGGSIKNLTINDGNCFSPSRNLIQVNSPSNVSIELNTLVYGNHAVLVDDNSGEVTVAFNQITNNDNYAVFRSYGTNTGIVKIYANNIINNRIGYQVQCNDRGIANHNFWGEGQLAIYNAAYCTVSNAKQLGASILLRDAQPGVQALRQTVSTEMTYAVDGKIGAQRSGGSDFNIIIVNHGQGSDENIPFFYDGYGYLNPCSNFYDVFLADNAAATNLILAFKYDLSDSCVSKIESIEYCGGTDSSKYPLWWYDPGNAVTDGWDRTGQNPQGPGAGGATGQETTCNINAKEIQVNIDNTGRPGLYSDLNFTPFVVGLPIVEGINLSQFTARFDGSKVVLDWRTANETNIKSFFVLRAEEEDGTYARISNQITAIGDQHIGGIYQFNDTTISYVQNYYYQLEVINNDGNSIGTYGPIGIITATPTPTITLTPTETQTPTINLTRTPTSIFTSIWTRTPTPYIYRSPTPYNYRTPTPNILTNTATPVGWPTPVRTYGPSPTGTRTFIIYPTTDLTQESASPSPGYPIGTQQTQTQTQTLPGYPLPETPQPTQLTPTPSLEPEQEDQVESTPTPEIIDEDEQPLQEFRWIFVLIGIAGGLTLIGAASLILAKTHLL